MTLDGRLFFLIPSQLHGEFGEENLKIAYFDCTFGAAGDMLLGALIAAGLPVNQWREQLSGIALPEDSYEVTIEDVTRCAIKAKKVTVKCLIDQHHAHLPSNEHSHDQGHAHTHSHEHSHDEDGHQHAHTHSHGHSHDHDSHELGNSNENRQEHDDSHAHDHDRGRSVKEILDIISRSKITENARKLATSIFRNLAVAESRVHGVEVEDVHFHEVGAVDAIVDVVGFAIGYDLMGFDGCVVSPLTTGSGTVTTVHGLYPIPAPATAYLIEAARAKTTNLALQYECLTPTGAAILTTIADRFGGLPSVDEISGIGYGAGDYNPGTHPNVCRLFVCAADQSALGSGGTIAGAELDLKSEVVAVIEANVDDCSPNVLAYAAEKAFSQGALDVSITPTTMKKGRSGHLITVLAKPADRRRLESVLLKETSTIGVRSHLVERLYADREHSLVNLSEHGSVRVKVARDQVGHVINVQPEYVDCVNYAEKSGLPLKEVFEQALSRFTADQKRD